MPRPTATAQYAARQTEIIKRLARIEQLLTEHAAAQATTPRNWGYAGDLGHVAELLERVETFLDPNSDLD